MNLPFYVIALSALLAVASWIDINERRIPNWLISLGLVVGFGFNIFNAGWMGAGNSILGAVLGLLIFLIPYISGKIGAGDVKLLVMAGTFLGPVGAFWAALFTLISGGIIAVVWAVYSVGLQSSMFSIVGSHTSKLVSRQSGRLSNSNRIVKADMPYALAISVGTLAALWWISRS